MGRAADTVMAAEARRCRAMIDGDLRTLDRLLDSRLLFSHANGAVDDKGAYLAKLAAGRIVYNAIDWSEQTVIELESTAVLCGRMTSRLSVEGVARRLDNRVATVWAFSEVWTLVAFQSTPLQTPV